MTPNDSTEPSQPKKKKSKAKKITRKKAASSKKTTTRKKATSRKKTTRKKNSDSQALSLKNLSEKTQHVFDSFITEVKTISKKSGEQIKHSNMADSLTHLIKKNKEQFNYHYHLHKLNASVATKKRELAALYPSLGKKTLQLLDKGDIDHSALQTMAGKINKIKETIKTSEKEIEKFIQDKG